ncbi:hypothetical protein B7494_g5346 [Chlorociboria aeruginascens]|nr:hypothetical protein B7494_g5346 [Chlorociboria aeruginascens]
MAPRIQWLYYTGRIVAKKPSLRVYFSIKGRNGTDDRPTSTSSLISSLIPPQTSRSPIPKSNPNPLRSASPIKFPLPRTHAPTSAGTAGINRLISMANTRQQPDGGASRSTTEEAARNNLEKGLSRQISRRWRPGDVYAPHDLSAVEMAKWKKREYPKWDVFDALDLDPMVEYKNFSIMSEYMTPMGRIKDRRETGLRPVNQRRIARAIRRSIGMGMMPSVHRHPEILMKMAQRYMNNSPTKGLGP